MLDINKIESDFEKVNSNLKKRNKDFKLELNQIVELNSKRKKITFKVEELKAKKNKISKDIGILAKNNNKNEIEKLKKEVSKINQEVEKLDNDLRLINDEINSKLSYIPNIPNDNIPLGKDENDNIEIKTWKNGKIKNDGESHWDIASKLGLVDFELGSKLSGSRFVVYTNLGAKIIRALADILINRHTNNGYKEMYLPLIVNKENMYGTGQLPKFEEDAYKIGDQYLIPTSEVPLTNTVRDKILEKEQLPIYLTSFTQCFRKEAGSAGRDTKGLIRLHQFNKVEMVKITDNKTSYEELEKMLIDAEECLQLFNLPYRVVELCGGDIGFSSAKTYDLEVWFPNQNKYREISSCSNCLDFQSKRIMARYKNDDNKNEYVHTLNGSGLAIDRLFAAILENYYDGDKLLIPDILKPYLGNIDFIK
ncbi:serine--tRNA ligase [Spiroplasma cantharicola]|uniref:Serine--tRNA ligase n=1 Tax=Spiroplasma cantharicola TaxID=362837 RepID=A0A0M4KBG8_9MOLU|nr:serine--tRNA ligase [Spiroplasma cantharicola]ALD65915.1 seryl-tRNA synthetase [Spiroplasma cantharicola]